MAETAIFTISNFGAGLMLTTEDIVSMRVKMCNFH
ncbi:hypothetical protein ABID42_004309 [Arcicella rosea]